MKNSPPAAKPQVAAKVRTPKKRQIIVNTGFQLRQLVPLAVYCSLLVIFLVPAIFYPLYRDASMDPSPIIRGFLSARIVSLHTQFWPAFILATVLAGLYALNASNHLAGPLYKLRVVMIQLAEGKSIVLRFRKGDELREFEDIMNRLGKRMESLSAGNVRQLSMIQKRLKWLKARLEMQEMENSEICKELDVLLKETGLDQYQTTGS